MAQAIRKKDVRKNCVDVEQVIRECLQKPETKDILEKAESVQSSELSKEILKLNSKNYAKYHQELIPIVRVKYKLTCRNYAVY